MILTLGYQWTLARAVDVEGVIYLAGGCSRERLLRNADADFDVVLFDPQLYLAGLNPEECDAMCGRLATYEWFGIPEVPGFDSTAQSRRDWDDAVKQHAKANWLGHAPTEEIADAVATALTLQQQIGCTHVICPTPLIREREDEGEELGLWLDEAESAAEIADVANPLLATVAIDEACLNQGAMEDLGFLDTIVDQVSSRTRFDGVYFVVGQTQQKHPFASSPTVLGCYKHLCQRFTDCGYEFIIPNFADLFGLVCTGLGATHYLGGASQSLRRLCLAPPSGGRGPLPVLYSHRTGAEYLTETDLNRIRDQRALRQAQDITPISRGLIQRLRSGGSAAELPQWAESSNNVRAARRHFLTRLCSEWSGLRGIAPEDRLELLVEWLDAASARALSVRTRVGEELRGADIPKDTWLSLLDS